MTDKLKEEELIGILRRAGRLPGLRGWHKETVEQIVTLIQKPEVTEEWYEEKAIKLESLVRRCFVQERDIYSDCKDFIRELVKEIQGK